MWKKVFPTVPYNKITCWRIGFGYWLLIQLQHSPLRNWQLLYKYYVIFIFFSRTYDDYIFNAHPQKSDTAKAACSWLTHRRHFGNPGGVWAVQEFGFIVVDVLDLDDKLRLGLYGLVGEPVQRLGSERVVGLFLTVQPLGGMNIPRVLINNENGTCPFAWQDVFDGTISFINIRVKLVKNSCEMRLTYKRVSDMEIHQNNS